MAAVNPNAHRPGPLLDPDVGSLVNLLPYLLKLLTKACAQIAKIASEYGKSPAQVMLSWAVQRGTSVVPKTVHEDRMIENKALFRLGDMHMTLINEIAQKKGTVRYLDPRNHIGFDIFCEDIDEPNEERMKGAALYDFRGIVV